VGSLTLEWSNNQAGVKTWKSVVFNRPDVSEEITLSLTFGWERGSLLAGILDVAHEGR